MSPATATTITQPMTTVCSMTSAIPMPARMASTSVGSVSSGQHDVVLTPQLIPRDVMRGYFALATVLQQQQPQSQMPSQAYGN